MVLQTLKRNDIRLVPYVPDRVLTTLIKNLHADPFFTTFATAREEEAVGIVAGAWMGGMRGAMLMQTSGFATLANVLASLVVPYQIPLIMFVSERGTLGEFNYGQSLVCRTMRPVLDSLAMEHHTMTRLDELEFIVDRSIKQAVATQAPVALILSPLLTGGKVFEVSDRMTARSNARNTKVMNRFDVTSRLVRKLTNEEAVIGGIGNTNFDLWAAGHRPQNFYMLGSMGLAFPIALGVALAQPKRRVFALEGDGSLLMQLGCLSTIATLAPKNLTMIVMDNGIYQITGAQPTPAAAVADLDRHRARLRHFQQRLGGGRGGLRAPDRPVARRIRPDADRRSHRRQAGRRSHAARSRADQGTLHDGTGRAAGHCRAGSRGASRSPSSVMLQSPPLTTRLSDVEVSVIRLVNRAMRPP